MKQITILLLAFSLLISCGKKKERILHLKAINPATGAVYPGLDWRVTATKTAGSGEKKVLDETGTLSESYGTIKTNLPKGVYYFQLMGDKQTEIQKIIVL